MAMEMARMPGLSIAAINVLSDEAGVDRRGRPFLPADLIGGERLTGLQIGAGNQDIAHRHLRRDSSFDIRRSAAHHAARQKRGYDRHDARHAEHDETLGVHEIQLPFETELITNHLEFA
ncbi:MAG: hypothetical protein J0H61_00440 [Alphaproteobacteria bacterium]|nr:hypothetical protein [Alphaproteobacteria bacterium]